MRASDFADHLQYEILALVHLFGIQHHGEGVKAFLEKEKLFLLGNKGTILRFPLSRRSL